MKVISLGLFESVLVDKATNTVSLINMIEEINAPEFPTNLQKSAFFCLLEKTNGESDEQDFNLRVLLANEEKLSQNFTLNFQGKNKNRLVLNIGNFVFEKEGILEFNINLNNGQSHSYCVLIKK